MTEADQLTQLWSGLAQASPLIVGVVVYLAAALWPEKKMKGKNDNG